MYNDAGRLITPQSTKDYLLAEQMLANASRRDNRNPLEVFATYLNNLTNNWGRGKFYEPSLQEQQQRELMRHIYNGY